MLKNQLQDQLQDLRYALRSLWKSPRFSIIAVLALAIGIGANTAMFSVVYNVLLRPLAYPRPDRLVFIQETSVRHGGTNPTAPATYADWRDQQDVFQAIAAAEAWGGSLTGEGRPEEVAGLHASASLLDVLGVQPMLGRGFAPQDGHVLLVSYGFWRRRLGGQASAIGRALRLNGESYEIIGVMPPGFQFPPFWQSKAEFWAPLEFPPSRLHDRGSRSLRVFGRLKDGISLQRAGAAMSAIARRLELAYPKTNSDAGAIVKPLEEQVVGQIRPALVVLLAAVGFLLLIACANVANLLLARASGRQKEVALRVALGASRWRLVRQFLAESALLSAAGAAIGVLLAEWGVRLLAVSIPEASRFTLPRYQEIGIGSVVLAFTLVVSFITAMLFGLAPALQFSRPDLHDALKDGGKGSSRHVRGPLRKILVVAELAISLMLLSGAGLMVRSLFRLSAIDAGFDPHNVLTMRVSLTGSAYATPERRVAFFRRVLDRAVAVPGIQAVSAINHLPLAGDLWGFPFLLEGQPVPAPQDVPNAVFRLVFPGYFQTMRTHLLRGRDFTERDDAGAPGVVIVNATMAAHYWPRGDAIGKRIRISVKDPWATVVGVVADAEQRDWGSAADNEYYFPFAQSFDNIQKYFTLVARTAGDPAALISAVEKAVWSLDPDLPVADVLSMQQVVDRAVWQPRFSTSLLTGFAALALILAAIGIYGVISYGVSQRGHEIGIRMALGARQWDVLRAVLGEGAWLAGVGSAIGLIGALALTRYLQTLLYEVSATDPATLIGAAALLGAVALGASWLPARRATRVDPAVVLRGE